MQTLRIFSLYDLGTNDWQKPFFSDHSENAKRSFRILVNDEQDKYNNVRNHPDQFVLFELGYWSSDSGGITLHQMPISLGNGCEFVKQQSLAA